MFFKLYCCRVDIHANHTLHVHLDSDEQFVCRIAPVVVVVVAAAAATVAAVAAAFFSLLFFLMVSQFTAFFTCRVSRYKR